MSPSPNPSILLVEDNPDDQDLVARALNEIKPSPRITVARDGVEGLQTLRAADTPSKVPDLIVLDLMMPRMTGFEFLRQVRSDPRLRTLPVVIFTSSDDVRDVRKAYESGASAYVQKPTGLHEYTNAVHSLARFWLGVNEPPHIPAEGLQRAL